MAQHNDKAWHSTAAAAHEPGEAGRMHEKAADAVRSPLDQRGCLVKPCLLDLLPNNILPLLMLLLLLVLLLVWQQDCKCHVLLLLLL
jgi:hypothetical protein